MRDEPGSPENVKRGNEVSSDDPEAPAEKLTEVAHLYHRLTAAGDELRELVDAGDMPRDYAKGWLTDAGVPAEVVANILDENEQNQT